MQGLKRSEENAFLLPSTNGGAFMHIVEREGKEARMKFEKALFE